MVPIHRSAARTSFRSETQATDSARKGCRAKTPATKALGAGSPVSAESMPSSRSVAATWSSTLVRWCPPGHRPQSWQSSMCDSDVIGCQVAPWRWVDAHATPSRLSPRETTGFRVTYTGSSQLTKSWWTTCAYTARVEAASTVPSQRPALMRSPRALAGHPHLRQELGGWTVERFTNVLVAQPVDEDRVADVVVRLAPAKEGAQAREAEVLEGEEPLAQEVARQPLPLGLVAHGGDGSQARQGVLPVLLVRHFPRARRQGVGRLGHGGAHGRGTAGEPVPPPRAPFVGG